MQPQIAISVISGVTAAISASIAVLQAIRTTRLKGEADVALERVKGQFNQTIETMKSTSNLEMERIKAEANKTLEELRSNGNIALEKIKIESTRRQKAFDLAASESEPVEIALSTAWHDIQIIREEIYNIIVNERCEKAHYKSHISPLINNISLNYAQWGDKVSDGTRSAWHNAKGCVMSVKELIEGFQNSPIGTIDIKSVCAMLSNLRDRMFDLQQVLIHEKQLIREEKMKKILSLLKDE